MYTHTPGLKNKKKQTSIDNDSQSCKAHFARRHVPGCTYIHRCILVTILAEIKQNEDA